MLHQGGLQLGVCFKMENPTRTRGLQVKQLCDGHTLGGQSDNVSLVGVMRS